jgi:hypothetical protein
LFGKNRWELPWKTVDDRIRGGSSESYLEIVKNGVRFYGYLDTMTLGGAGFASQQYWFPIPLNAKGYRGIYLIISKADGKRYSINLTEKYPENRGDGRNRSQINYKAPFVPQDGVMYLLWEEFLPNFRGRPADAPPLNLEHVSGFNLMMQSYFDKQSGSFELIVSEIGLFE